MSMWTHVAAVMDVDTHIEAIFIEDIVREMLKDAPKITGSEGNADVFVNVLPGHNVNISMDCERCKYGHTVKPCDESGFTCEGPDDYRCPDREYQTRVVITVVGDLRDRERCQTKAEWDAFKKFVEKHINDERGFSVRNCACRLF